MADVHIPPNMAATVRALAAQAQRDPQVVFEEVVAAGIAATRKATFDRELVENYEAGLAGGGISEEESLARVEAIERGE